MRVPYAVSSLLCITVLAANLSAQQPVYSDIIAYGRACGTVQILPGHALIGKNFVIGIKSGDATSGVIVLGNKRVNIPFGGGCSLYANQLVIAGWLSKTKGQATLSLKVPNQTALLGQKYTMQVAAFNTNGLGVSRGIEFKIGNKKPPE